MPLKTVECSQCQVVEKQSSCIGFAETLKFKNDAVPTILDRTGSAQNI